MYDPRVGRFYSLDPLDQKFPWYSPYLYAGNSPIYLIDIDGAGPSRNPNWVEKFLFGFGKGFIGHEDGVSIGEQGYTTDYHAGKVWRSKEMFSNKVNEYKNNPSQLPVDIYN